MDAEEIVQNFKDCADNNPITKQEGNFSLLLYGTAFTGVISRYFDELYDFDFGKLLYITSDKDGILFFNKNKYLQATKDTYRRYRESENIESLREHKWFQNYKEEIDDQYKNFSVDDLENRDSDQLKGNLENLFELFHKLLVATVFSEAMNQDVVEQFHSDLKKTGTSTSDLMEAAFIKDFYDITYRENSQLLNFNENEKVSNSQWILCDYFLGPDIEEARGILKEKVSDVDQRKLKEKQNQYEDEVEENKKKLNQFKKEITQKEENLLDFVRFAIRIRDTRKEHMQKLMTMISHSARSFLDRIQAAPSLAPYMFCFDFLGHDDLPSSYEEELKARKSGSAGLFTVDQYSLVSVSNSDQLKKEVQSEIREANDNDADITGQVAYEGKVSGKVKVVSSTDEFDKFEEGDVLVTSMTRPEFVPIMKKAAAVVTDEGGITCHAAIVSRELEIPCIIGTETATQVLEDGDKVEVNADEGVVKILSRDE